MRQFLSLLFLCILCSTLSPTVEAVTLPSNSGQIITATKSHILTMMYYLQPKVPVEIPDDIYFVDVPTGAWYETASRYVVSQQIMAATDEYKFSPTLHVTRGLVAVVIANASRADVGIYPNVFTDAESQWYQDSANWCAQNGIIYGYTSDYFGGNDPVTREQLAVILYKYARFISQSTGNTNEDALSLYSDHDQTSEFARTALAWCVNRGLILGTNNAITPHQPATRAEIAFAIYRLLEL